MKTNQLVATFIAVFFVGMGISWSCGYNAAQRAFLSNMQRFVHEAIQAHPAEYWAMLEKMQAEGGGGRPVDVIIGKNGKLQSLQ